MNLIIDIGNSRTKIAIFSEENIVFSTVALKLEHAILEELIGKFSTLNNAIISITGECKKEIYNWLTRRIKNFVLLDDSIKLPFNNLYKSSTLGNDRKAAIAGAHTIFPQQDCLVIDAGTAITFDYINKKKNYH